MLDVGTLAKSYLNVDYLGSISSRYYHEMLSFMFEEVTEQFRAHFTAFIIVLKLRIIVSPG